jgi:phosphoglycerate transport regulatory protein PgtC
MRIFIVMYQNNISISTVLPKLGPRLSRRSLLAAAPSALAASCFAKPARAADDRIVVVTSFPEELTTRYEQEFERAHPGTHVQFVWKQSRDALAELSKPDQGGADVYWAPALGNFPVLRDRGAFRKISVDRSVLPGRLGEQQLSDPAGTFEAYDVAGYGIVVNPAALRDRSLPEPQSWRDLALPHYAGQIVMPIASKVGFSPALYDIILQSEGWESGWALLSEIAGNAELLASGHMPTAAVREGRAALGLTIDFFALSAQANSLPVSFIYPRRTAFLPAHIAIAASTKHYEGAKAFFDFMLSREGQKLMMEADSSRHPARPDAYQDRPVNIVDPFRPPSETFPYDSEIGRRRPGLVGLLFDLSIVERHAELVSLWRAIHTAEAKLERSSDGGARQRIASARRLAEAIPVSVAESTDSAFLERFSSRDVRDVALTAHWRIELDAARSKAWELVKTVEPAL